MLSPTTKLVSLYEALKFIIHHSGSLTCFICISGVMTPITCIPKTKVDSSTSVFTLAGSYMKHIIINLDQ